jgi:hypothetical protein
LLSGFAYNDSKAVTEARRTRASCSGRGRWEDDQAGRGRVRGARGRQAIGVTNAQLAQLTVEQFRNESRAAGSMYLAHHCWAALMR